MNVIRRKIYYPVDLAILPFNSHHQQKRRQRCLKSSLLPNSVLLPNIVELEAVTELLMVE